MAVMNDSPDTVNQTPEQSGAVMPVELSGESTFGDHSPHDDRPDDHLRDEPPADGEPSDAGLSGARLSDANFDESAERPPTQRAEVAESAGVTATMLDRLAARARCPHPLWHPIRFTGWAVSTLFGIVTLILMLAVVAAVPILNFVALGYLLEVEGRVARTGRWRDAFPLLELAPRIGSMVLGVWLFLLPVRFLAWSAADARLISPGSGADRFLHLCLLVSMVLVTGHLCLALARGGRLSMFFRPLKNLIWFARRCRDGEYWDDAEQTVRDFVVRLRVPHLLRQGFQGWLGAGLWLVVPTAIFAAANKPDGAAAIVSILGGLLLALVFSWVPFLQARYAAEGRFSAFRELGTIRELYRRAPLCWTLAAIVTYALALPLFLTSIALPPRDALWLVTPIFIVTIYPARVFVGWAYYQATQRPHRAWWSLRLALGTLLMPTLGLYTFLLFFMQFIGSSGKLVLFQHHALFLPRPF